MCVRDGVSEALVSGCFVGPRGEQQPVPEPRQAPPDPGDAGAAERAGDPEGLRAAAALQGGLRGVSEAGGWHADWGGRRKINEEQRGGEQPNRFLH